MNRTTSSSSNGRKTQPSAASRTLSSKSSAKPRFPFQDTRQHTSRSIATERCSYGKGARVEKKPAAKVLRAHLPRNKNPATTALVHIFVNNRLGTRLEITCSASDSFGDVKKLVAFQSGIKAEAILLKRQGMRPFKDALTLEDYEIGNGSSLDMEVDTTD
ncbi:MAG: hypothetical protein LQ346_004090 [Caloplaca aetnensis]|nr:MAG: hypothetical protein LQ346_004090 [Caloplaca aetnensis]